MKQILILGCGWVGEFVAKNWKLKGYDIWASTTNTEKYHRLKEDGIFSFVIDFDKEVATSTLLPEYFDAILISVPASRKNSIEQIRNRYYNVRTFVNQLRYSKIIFLSSTGIYPDVSRKISEFTFANQELDPQLLLAEETMLSLQNGYVYRLGGLFGLNRVFAKFYADKQMTTGDQLANFIHIEDVYGLLDQGISYPLRERVYNAVAPLHPTKKEVVLASAAKHGFTLPISFAPQETYQKLVDGSLLQNDLNYVFKYPSPLDF